MLKGWEKLVPLTAELKPAAHAEANAAGGYMYGIKLQRDCLTTKVRQSLFYTQNQKIQAAFATPDIIFGQKFK